MGSEILWGSVLGQSTMRVGDAVVDSVGAADGDGVGDTVRSVVGAADVDGAEKSMGSGVGAASRR